MVKGSSPPEALLWVLQAITESKNLLRPLFESILCMRWKQSTWPQLQPWLHERLQQSRGSESARSQWALRRRRRRRRCH